MQVDKTPIYSQQEALEALQNATDNDKLTTCLVLAPRQNASAISKDDQVPQIAINQLQQIYWKCQEAREGGIARVREGMSETSNVCNQVHVNYSSNVKIVHAIDGYTDGVDANQKLMQQCLIQRND